MTMLKILLVIVGACSGIFLFRGAALEKNEPVFRTSSIRGALQQKVLVTDKKEFTLTKPPQRIVSCTFAADEIILSLVDPARIQAVTFLCDLPEYSTLSGAAKKIPNRITRVKDTEKLFSLKPDLVIVDPYNTPDPVMLLSQTGIPILKIAYPQSLLEIEQNILILGEVLGVEKEAKDLANKFTVQTMQAKANAPEKKPRVLYMLGGSVSPTKGTLLDEIIQTAGGVNCVSGRGNGKFVQITLEELMIIDPDVIITGGSFSDLLNHPSTSWLGAKKRGNIFNIKPNTIEVSSHIIVQGIDEISKYLRQVKLEDE